MSRSIFSCVASLFIINLILLLTFGVVSCSHPTEKEECKFEQIGIPCEANITHIGVNSFQGGVSSFYLVKKGEDSSYVGILTYNGSNDYCILESQRKNEKTGRVTCFDLNGNILSIGSFDHGEKDSLWYFFHPNGMVESKVFFENGRKLGSWYEYDSLGTLIHYCLLDLNNTCVFSRRYNSEGDLTSQGGEPWVLFINNETPLITNKFYKGNLFVARDPFFWVSATVQNDESPNLMFELEDLGGGCYYFNFQAKCKGVYRVTIELEVKKDMSLIQTYFKPLELIFE